MLIQCFWWRAGEAMVPGKPCRAEPFRRVTRCQLISPCIQQVQSLIFIMATTAHCRPGALRVFHSFIRGNPRDHAFGCHCVHKRSKGLQGKSNCKYKNQSTQYPIG